MIVAVARKIVGNFALIPNHEIVVRFAPVFLLRDWDSFWFPLTAFGIESSPQMPANDQDDPR